LQEKKRELARSILDGEQASLETISAEDILELLEHRSGKSTHDRHARGNARGP
jgi:hypothetical protein